MSGGISSRHRIYTGSKEWRQDATLRGWNSRSLPRSLGAKLQSWKNGQVPSLSVVTPANAIAQATQHANTFTLWPSGSRLFGCSKQCPGRVGVECLDAAHSQSQTNSETERKGPRRNRRQKEKPKRKQHSGGGWEGDTNTHGAASNLVTKLCDLSSLHTVIHPSC